VNEDIDICFGVYVHALLGYCSALYTSTGTPFQYIFLIHKVYHE